MIDALTDGVSQVEPAAYIAEGLRPLAVPIDRLKLLPGNPRVGDVDAIARSLKKFGQRKPVVAHRDGTVLAGNHTLQAAHKLQWAYLAVVWVDDDARTAKAFAAADNHTGDLGHYDEELLAELLADVRVDDELWAATSYTDGDLAKLLAGPDMDGDSSEQLGQLAYSIMVECRDETHQAELLTRFGEEGLDCRPITT